MIPYAHYAKENGEIEPELCGFKVILSVTVCF